MNQKEKDYGKSLKNIMYLSHFGISVVAPLVLMTLLGSWLAEKFSWPDWAVLIFIFLGIGAMITSFLKNIKHMLQRGAGSATAIKNKKAAQNEPNTPNSKDHTAKIGLDETNKNC